jgi:2'-5' RNA ligase
MTLLRTFIAVDIPSIIQQAIQQKTEELRKALGASFVRWVSVENIHITIKFLGEVSHENINALSQILISEAAKVPAFDILVGGLGSFPSLRRPRVLFIGIQAPAELEALFHGIEAACLRFGYESEPRAFSPHLTIGRVKQDASQSDQQKIRRLLETTTVASLGIARIDMVHLYKSELRPGGAWYARLFSTPLNSHPHALQN